MISVHKFFLKREFFVWMPIQLENSPTV